jgi:long-chain acyl-CoA synthetase
MASTIPRMFQERVRATPDRRAFTSFDPRSQTWRDFSWTDFEAMARAFGLGLIDLGVRRGDVVAILGQTRHEWVVCDIGALGIGAVTVGLYPTLAPEGIGSMHYVLDHSEAKVVVVESVATLKEKLGPILAKIPRATHIVVWDWDESASVVDPRVMSMADVMARGEAANVRTRDAWRDACEAALPGDLALLIYTSGTTGQPKGAMLSHGNVASVQSAMQGVMPRDEDGTGGTTVSFLPLAHAAERIVGHYGRIQQGSSTHFARSFETLLDDISIARPTRFGSVPRIFEKAYARVQGEMAKLEAPMQEMARRVLAAGIRAARAKRTGEAVDPETQMMAGIFAERMAAPVRARFGGQCAWFVSGAAPIAVEILEFFDACGMPTYEAYGLTETAGLLTFNRPDALRYGTVGKPLPGVDVKIAEDGEILARGPNVFVGYYKDAAATAECMQGGWFHTGDIGRVDESGFLLVTDRKKNILITAGGKNITPSNIENEVKNDALVSYCHMHADRRAFPTALICLDPERLTAFAKEKNLGDRSAADLASDESVRVHVQAAIDRANLAFARYEQIRKFAILPREFSIDGGELTPTLKVKRKEVDRIHADVIEAMYR